MCTNYELVFRIELPGIPESLRSTAERDVRQLVDFVLPIAERLDLPFLLRLVRITSHYQRDVNRLLKENWGYDRYVAVRKGVHAIGRTFPMRSDNGEIGFAVLVDAKSIDQWHLTNPWCFTTILHELCHVLFNAQHLKTLGLEEYVALENTRERLLASRARLFLDEFSADRLVDFIISTHMKKEDGQPWSLREIDEAREIDWPQVFLNRLTQMPEFIDEKVFEYKVQHGDLEKFRTEVPPYITDTLRLLSHMAARYMKTDSWPEILNNIGKSEASRRFMKEHLGIFLDHLGESGIISDESTKGMTDAIEGIFLNCGVGYETTPKGLYISVGWPST